MNPLLRLLITSGDMSEPSLMFSGWIALGLLFARMGGIW